MLPATSGKCTPKTHKVKKRFTGIVKAAQDLGVERSHLYRVLTGQRPSESLKRRYAEWQAQQATQNAAK